MEDPGQDHEQARSSKEHIETLSIEDNNNEKSVEEEDKDMIDVSDTSDDNPWRRSKS